MQFSSPTFGVVDPERQLHPLLTSFSQPKNVLWLASSANAAMDQLEWQLPDLLLTRLHLPDMTGAMFCNWITDRFTDLPIIVVSSTANLEYVEELISCGVRAYLSLQHAHDHLQPAVQHVADGGAYFSEDVMRMLVKELPGTSQFQAKRNAYALETTAHHELLKHIEQLNRLGAKARANPMQAQDRQEALASLLQSNPA